MWVKKNQVSIDKKVGRKAADVVTGILKTIWQHTTQTCGLYIYIHIFYKTCVVQFYLYTLKNVYLNKNEEIFGFFVNLAAKENVFLF